MKRMTRNAKFMPELVMQMFRTDQHLADHMAIEAIRSGQGTSEHIDAVITVGHILWFGAAIAKSKEAEDVSRFVQMAAGSIADRYKATGKVGATGEEMKAICLGQSFQEDWWKRQSGKTRSQAVAAVARWHEMIAADRKAQRVAA